MQPKVKIYSRLTQASLWSDLIASLRTPSFWLFGSWLDLVTGYRRLWMGIAWAVLPFLSFCLVIGPVYASFSSSDVRQFLPHLTLGFWFWRFFVQTITESCSVISGHQVYILQGNYRVTDYVCKVIAKGMFNLIAAVPVVASIILWSGTAGGPAQLLFGVLALIIAIFVVFLNAIFVSIVAARFPALREIISTILLFGFLLTPIMWRLGDFRSKSPLAVFVTINPVTNLLELFRAPLLGSNPSIQVFALVLTYMAISSILASIAYRRYSRKVVFWK